VRATRVKRTSHLNWGRVTGDPARFLFKPTVGPAFYMLESVRRTFAPTASPHVEL